MIEELLEHLGMEDIRPLGNEIGARCPMHEKRTGRRETRPNHWSVNRVSGFHHCFSCEYSGSLVRLIMDLSKAGLWDAHQLMNKYDVVLDEMEEAPWEPPVMFAVEQQLESFGMPPPRAMERRRLDERSVQKYRIRWDSDDKAWVFPIVGPTGELWGWQTKSINRVRNHPPGIKKGRTLFGIEVLSSGTSVVLVESPLDVAYLDTLAYESISSFGAQVSDDQMRLIIERCDQLILALDDDDAGRKETRKLLKARWHHRIPILIFNYWGLKGKDPGELRPDEVEVGLARAVMAAFW